MSTSPKWSSPFRPSSFVHAFRGVYLFLTSERHALLHSLATLAVIAAGFFFHISEGEALAITGMIGLVWTAEMFNTCIEKIMDFISRDRHPSIRFIKDVSAGAVLVASLAAFLTACFIFIPKII